MIVPSALIRHNRWTSTSGPGAIVAVVLLVLVVSCSSGGSGDPPTSDPPLDGDGVPSATSTVPPAPAMTATPNVAVIEIIDGKAVVPLGSNEWWDTKAPVAEFRALSPVLSGSPSGDAIWSLYAATFVASEWLAGREPEPASFGPFIADLTLEELSVLANDLFAQITALGSEQIDWLRPYQSAATDAEFTLVVNLGFAACLNIATWDECVDRASGG